MDNENAQFQFVAGNLALDFVNTVAFRADPERREERLVRAEDIERWARAAQLPDLAAIRRAPRLRPAALRNIRAVREELFAVFYAIARRDPIPDDMLSRVSTALHECAAKRRLAVDGAEIRWVWRATARRADFLLYPILTTAADLLTSASRDLIRQCEDANCGWLFLDRSNARKRRWCSMADCGNRNKARQFYRREAGIIDVDV